MNNILYKYKNGNVEVSIYSDGTKIQEWPDNEDPKPLYPNSFDLKITDYCDLGCSFCHEKSSIKGIHGDLKTMADLVIQLPSGTEIAIGGGNPLDHPELIEFLEHCKINGMIPNLTVNYKHLILQFPLISKLLNEKLIYGLGVSITDDFDPIVAQTFDNYKNIVYHVIAGVNSVNVLEKISKSKINKVLILGYKDVGRGISYHNEHVDILKKEWYNELPKYVGKMLLSFDNLAISQLNIKRFFNEKSWKLFYCGGDGEFTFYIDLPNRKYAISSTSPVKYDLTDNISEMFSHVRSIK